MKRKGRIILLVLSCTLFAIFGCRKEGASQETAVKAVDHGELKIREALNMVSDWRFYHRESARNDVTMSVLRDELNRLKDPVRRKKYVKRLADIIFAYPLDATDPGPDGLRYPIAATGPGTRKEQWSAFCEMSDLMSFLTDPYSDMEYLWEIKLRRLKRIQDEVGKAEAFLSGHGVREAHKEDHDRWVTYHKRVQGVYNGFVEELSRLINNILMTHTLSYEKWSDIRSQLEAIIGHEVEIKPAILKLWEEKRKKEQAQNTK